jgi:hypothetical protein
MMKAPLLLGLLLAIGCGSNPPPAITSLSVNPAEVAPGGETTLTVVLENFQLRDPDAQTAHGLRAASEDEHGEGEAGDYPDGGHFHVYLDSVETNPLLNNCPDYCEHPGFSNSIRLKIPDDAIPGSHQLILRLNADTHMFLVPEIEKSTPLTITSES